jgi:hypothetical protein
MMYLYIYIIATKLYHVRFVKYLGNIYVVCSSTFLINFWLLTTTLVGYANVYIYIYKMLI